MFACATSCIFMNHALLEKIKKKTRANAQYYEGLQRLFAGFPITITKEEIKEVRKDGQEKKKDGEEKGKNYLAMNPGSTRATTPRPSTRSAFTKHMMASRRWKSWR